MTKELKQEMGSLIYLNCIWVLLTVVAAAAQGDMGPLLPRFSILQMFMVLLLEGY
jgi:hypothetical protein